MCCIQSTASDMDLVLDQWSPEMGFKGTGWQMLCKRPQSTLEMWSDSLWVSVREWNTCTISSAVTTFIDMSFRLPYIFMSFGHTWTWGGQRNTLTTNQRYSKKTSHSSTSGIGQSCDASKYFASLQTVVAPGTAEPQEVSYRISSFCF